MSALTDRIENEHTYRPSVSCSCDEVFHLTDVEDERRQHTRHVAEVTEAAVREQVARDIAALDGSPLLEGLVSINGGAQAMLEYALATIRGES